MEKELACFTIRILSAENGSWQGECLTGDKTFRFQSELQLLRWIHAAYILTVTWNMWSGHPRGVTVSAGNPLKLKQGPISAPVLLEEKD